MRPIDADALLETEPEVCADYGEEYGSEFGYSRDQIANAPTISPDDVRGVVHCRECIYPTKREPEIICPASCIGLKPYDYCSHGVRMTEVKSDA